MNIWRDNELKYRLDYIGIGYGRIRLQCLPPMRTFNGLFVYVFVDCEHNEISRNYTESIINRSDR